MHDANDTAWPHIYIWMSDVKPIIYLTAFAHVL